MGVEIYRWSQTGDRLAQIRDAEVVDAGTRSLEGLPAGEGRARQWIREQQEVRQIGRIRQELTRIAEQQLLLDGGLGLDTLAQSIKNRACTRLLESLVSYSGREVSLAELVGLERAKSAGERRRLERMMVLINSLDLPAGTMVAKDGQKILTPQKPLASLTLKETLRQVPDYLLKAIKNFPRRLKEDLENIWAVGNMSRKHQAYCALGFLAASILPEAAGWLLPVPVWGGKIAKTIVRAGVRLGIGVYQEHQRRILEGELDERQRLGVIANLSLINALAAGAGVSLVGFSTAYLADGKGLLGRIGKIGLIGGIGSLFDRLPKEVTVRINPWGWAEKGVSGLLTVARGMSERVGEFGGVREFGKVPGKGKMSDGAVGLAEKLRQTRFYIRPGSSFHQQATDWAEDLTGGDQLARDNILGKVYRTLRRKFSNGQLDESIIWSGTVTQRWAKVEMIGDFGKIVKVVRPQGVVYETNQVVLTDILEGKDFEHLVYVMGGDVDRAKRVAEAVCQDGCGPNQVIDFSGEISKVWQTGNLSARKAAEGIEEKVVRDAPTGRLYLDFKDIEEFKDIGEMGEMGRVMDSREMVEMADLRIIDKNALMGDFVGGLKDGTGKLGKLGSLEGKLGSLELKITSENNSVWKAAARLAQDLPLKNGYTADNFAGGLLQLAQEKGLLGEDEVFWRTHPGQNYDLQALFEEEDINNRLGRYLDLDGKTLTEWLVEKTKKNG